MDIRSLDELTDLMRAEADAAQHEADNTRYTLSYGPLDSESVAECYRLEGEARAFSHVADFLEGTAGRRRAMRRARGATA